MDKEPTIEEIEHNKKLQYWYPLGQVDAIWNMVEHLSAQIDHEHIVEIGQVFDALQKLDDKIRADRYPFPKNKVKQSNGMAIAGRKTKSRGTRKVPRST